MPGGVVEGNISDKRNQFNEQEKDPIYPPGVTNRFVFGTCISVKLYVCVSCSGYPVEYFVTPYGP